MSLPALPLADLHLHLYGCLRADSVLAMLVEHPAPALSRYEDAFESAFGARSTVRDLLDRHRRGDIEARAEFRALFAFGDEDAGNFRRFQAKFDLIIAASRFGEAYRARAAWPAALEELDAVARAVLDDQVRQGLVHAEQRFFFGMAAPVDFVEAAIARLLAIYAQETRLEARLAISLPREDPFRGWDAISRASLGPFGHVLTGVDFCFVEEGHPPKEKAEIFAAVREHGERRPDRALAVLYHVGESFTDKSLESAVRWVEEAAELGAHRLGHAIALGVDPEAYGEHQRRESVAERRDQIAYDLRHRESLERRGLRVDGGALEEERRRLNDLPPDHELVTTYDRSRLHDVRARQDLAMERVKRLDAVVETCPTSNLRIGGIEDGAHHPVKRFLDAQLRVVVASDDPGLFDTTLAQEIAWVQAACGLEDEAAFELARGALDARSEVLTGRVPHRRNH